MYLRVKKGAAGRKVRLFIAADAEEYGGVTGLRSDSPGARACYIHEGELEPTEIPLVPAVAGRHLSGGFCEIDAEAMPGLYEIQVPDAALDGPGSSTVMMLQMPGAAPSLIEFDLVAYDAYDGDRLGLACLSQDSRHAVLERAFREVVPAIIEEYQQQKARAAAREGQD